MTTKRCQEWTTEYVQKLEEQGLVTLGAAERAHGERDSPTHGIFGYRHGENSA